MIVIDVRCRTCGRSWTPSSAEIRAGVWKWCPPCRAGPTEVNQHHPDHDTHEPTSGRTERTSP
jgi:phage FluMu protein Com